MKTNTPNSNSSEQKSQKTTPSKKGAVNPGKPNNNPDQTPDREVQNVPSAKTAKSSGTKIGFKK